MVELMAAVAGAAITVTAMALGGMSKRGAELRESVLRVTAGLEHIRSEISLIRTELHNDRAELFGRVNSAEQRITRVESLHESWTAGVDRDRRANG